MNKGQFNEEFNIFRGQLRSYLLRITASIQDTEDLLQDTWIKGTEKIDTFRGNSSLKTWVFTIASNLAIDRQRKKKRWPENVTDICKEAAMKNQAFFEEAMKIRMTSPQGEFEIKEHISFCFTCVSKSLPVEQHLSLLLKEIYDFKVAEIAVIMQTTEAMVKYYLHTSRSRMTTIFEGRCALINKEGVCHQCSELNGIFNPKQDKQEALNKIAMVKASEKGDKEHLFNLRTHTVKGLDPFESGAAELQLHHLEHNRAVMEKYLNKSD